MREQQRFVANFIRIQLGTRPSTLSFYRIHPPWAAHSMWTMCTHGSLPAWISNFAAVGKISGSRRFWHIDNIISNLTSATANRWAILQRPLHLWNQLGQTWSQWERSNVNGNGQVWKQKLKWTDTVFWWQDVVEFLACSLLDVQVQRWISFTESRILWLRR